MGLFFVRSTFAHSSLIEIRNINSMTLHNTTLYNNMNSDNECFYGESTVLMMCVKCRKVVHHRILRVQFISISPGDESTGVKNIYAPLITKKSITCATLNDTHTQFLSRLLNMCLCGRRAFEQKKRNMYQ